MVPVIRLLLLVLLFPLRSSDPNPEGALWAGLAPPCSCEEKLCL